MQIAILHHTNDVSTVGADSNMVEAVLHSAHVKQQAAAVDVNEAHDAILWQHSQNLRKERLKVNLEELWSVPAKVSQE